jgi:hypothetical protein
MCMTPIWEQGSTGARYMQTVFERSKRHSLGSASTSGPQCNCRWVCICRRYLRHDLYLQAVSQARFVFAGGISGTICICRRYLRHDLYLQAVSQARFVSTGTSCNCEAPYSTAGYSTLLQVTECNCFFLSSYIGGKEGTRLRREVGIPYVTSHQRPKK